MVTPRISYSQNQEDILLDRFFAGHVGTYVDVGAHHPVVDNNTQFFYERGWTGLNIEPQPELARLLAEMRPRDLNLAVAVSADDSELPFYHVPQCPGLSTLCQQEAEQHRRRGFQVVLGTVAARSLASLIAEHHLRVPDFLCIDVEGHEDQVVRGMPLDWWQPAVIVIESTRPLSTIPSHETWEPVLLERGYHFAVFNGVNRFYVREDLRQRLAILQVPVNALDQYRTRQTALLETEVGRLANRVKELEELATSKGWFPVT
jgi:FkbM family methyltransferase